MGYTHIMRITRSILATFVMLTSIYASLYSITSQASVTYTLVYDPKTLNSQQDLPSLKQALVKLAVYANGIPIGIMYRKVDENQQISLQGPYNINVVAVNVSVLSEHPKNLECLGTAMPNQILLQIECLPKLDK